MPSLLEKRQELDNLLEDANANGCFIFYTWKSETIKLLPPALVKKINLLCDDDFDINNKHNTEIIKVILDDEIYKLSLHKNKATKADLEKLKLLQAREENLDFELQLADMICGNNKLFPYKSSSHITAFFRDLGLPWKHDGSTRNAWSQNQLKMSNVHIIDKIIVEGLFKKKYFHDETKNFEAAKFETAKNEFKKFIDDSLMINEPINLSGVFGLNVRNELLFNKKTETMDETLNDLVDKSKEFFIKGDKQIAIEKLWDAFERMKTLFDPNKKTSITKLIKIMSNKLETTLWENEFRSLTEVGNNYQIRHHETNKKPISSDTEREYLFFRMLSLMDFALNKVAINFGNNIF
jgi:hypothetical protein